MPYDTELQRYIANLGLTIRNLDKLGNRLDTFGDALGTAGDVVDTIDDTGDAAGKIRKAIDDQLTVLKLTKQAGPLKTPSKVFEKLLKAIRPAVAEIEKAVDKLNGKKDATDGGDEKKGEFLDKLEKQLDAAEQKLKATASELQKKAAELEVTQAAMREFLEALDKADYAAFNGLKSDVAKQVKARNDVSEPLVKAFDKIMGKVDGVLDLMQDAKVELISADFADLDVVEDLMDQIAGPLKVAAAAIKPVEPILDAVGFAVDLVLGPVFDFLTRTLGIDDLLDDVASDIRKLFPEADFLDPLIANIQDLLDDIRTFNKNLFGIENYLEDVDIRLYAGVVGDALLGPTGIGTYLPEVVIGDRKGDILDARGGDDLVKGFGGNDILVAGEGDDLFYGGAGTDMVYFGSYFNQYEFAKDSDGEIIVTHVKPAKGEQNEGSTKLFGIEKVVFKNISFKIGELKKAKIGGSVLDGDGEDNLIFLNSSGTPVSGYHVANGNGGNDRIFGSALNDRLNGGNGNDVLLPGLGDDLAYGDTGSDYYQMLESGSNGTNDINLEDGWAYTTEGTDQLFGIENLIIQGNGDHILIGNHLSNQIISADGDDVLAGRGGGDIISSGAGDDYIVTGSGTDRTFAGNNNDFIVAAGKPVAGKGEVHDGGEHRDILSYSLDWNVVTDVRSSFNSPSRIGTEFRNAIEDVTDWNGSVRILAAKNEIQHINGKGKVVAVDKAVDIEHFIGTDRADVIWGAVGTWELPVLLHGAGGNDKLHTHGANTVRGGTGDDLVKVTRPESNGSGGINFEGGGGIDTLDLRGIGEARWWFSQKSGGGFQISAKDTDYSGRLNQGGSSKFFANIDGFEKYILADGDHYITQNPGFSAEREWWLGDGDDEFLSERGFNDLHAQGGDDVIRITGGSSGGGTIRGGSGDDSIEFDASDEDARVFGGNGNDYVHLHRMKGVSVDGGDGFDTLVVNPTSHPSPSGAKAAVDLLAGTVIATGLSNGFTQTKIDTSVIGFERVIGTEGTDTLKGNNESDTLIGREGNDLLMGRGGRDKLYGGGDHDSIYGEGGDDRIHGGAGNDLLDGGAGTDTADFSYVAPDGTRAEMAAGNFGGVVANLLLGTSSGMGADRLISIENVFGSGGNDTLTGNDADNVLAGANGDDSLIGNGGADFLLTGEGNDRAEGGAGNDRISIGLGNKSIDGGDGFDVVDLGGKSGVLTLDLARGRYDATFDIYVAVWLDTGTNEGRVYKGVSITPEQVKQTNAVFSDSYDDLTRELPPSTSTLASDFLIKEVARTSKGEGEFDNIEKFVGGASSVNILLSGGTDRYDGTNSDNDVLDFSAISRDVKYELATGSSNLAIAKGDVLKGIEGVAGGAGDDRLFGDGAANVLKGGLGADTLMGGRGADQIGGEEGRDRVLGGAGNDRLFGGDGADVLGGGKGRDRLFGRDGNDALTGGRGADRFVFNKGDDKDRITDFGNGADKIVIHTGASRFAQLNISRSGDDTLVRFADVTITLEDTRPGELERGDFVF